MHSCYNLPSLNQQCYACESCRLRIMQCCACDPCDGPCVRFVDGCWRLRLAIKEVGRVMRKRRLLQSSASAKQARTDEGPAMIVVQAPLARKSTSQRLWECFRASNGLYCGKRLRSALWAVNSSFAIAFATLDALAFPGSKGTHSKRQTSLVYILESDTNNSAPWHIKK